RVAQAALSLRQQESAFEVFQKYTVPRTMRELNGAVQGAEVFLRYHQLRVDRQVARLASLQKQIQLCTIRAPHHGCVVYANDNRRQIVIEEGMPVYQQQDLFYLPDLTNMVVVALLHESIVDEISNGMRAKVQVEGMPNRLIEGHVTSVSQLATYN